ncbi:hypothetical protein ACFV0T_38210 [Streptomyces sp. NPDC059582]|uniref:hypothetical protein n=1 Tax=Streptomyces sp. NPDC059582 TaxID=3346875 RepID=UPI003676C3C0
MAEGTAAAWERTRYEWDATQGRAAITSHESKVFVPGGGWVFRLTAEDGGTRIDIELNRTPSTLSNLSTVKGKMIAALLPLAAGSLQKSYRAPLKAR